MNALAYRHAELLKSIALKLVDQANPWHHANNAEQANRRLALAGERAKHFNGDESLSTQIARARRALGPGFISQR